MPTYEKIDGVWREVWSAHVNINGVWRDVNMFSKVDDWKETHRHIIEERDIVGFRLVYKVNPNRVYPQFPELKTNLKIPVEFGLSGDLNGMNTEIKGAVFHYERFGYEEGIYMYEGSLYAVLKNGCLVDVSLTKDTEVNNDDERILTDIPPGVKQVWATNKTRYLNIEMQAHLSYEMSRYHMYGWNSFFDTEDFIYEGENIEDTNADKKDLTVIESRIILPTKNRLKSFSPVASIGVARNLKIEKTMMGGYGILDQTINFIKVNDVLKPFVIEIY